MAHVHADEKGTQNEQGILFELTGGRLCLDLVNTVDNRPGPARQEHLNRYEELVDWSVQTGIVTRREGQSLKRRSRKHSRRATAALANTLELRESLFSLFSAAAAGRPLPEAALEALNRRLPVALARLRLKCGTEGPEWSWAKHEKGAGDLNRFLAPVVDSAAELLTSPDLTRVRECEADPCSWLFLDHSRNHSRRWCDMSVCGNRVKARRHYRKSRAGS